MARTSSVAVARRITLDGKEAVCACRTVGGSKSARSSGVNVPAIRTKPPSANACHVDAAIAQCGLSATRRSERVELRHIRVMARRNPGCEDRRTRTSTLSTMPLA